MFSFAYNYIYFFLNYEILVLVCFLLFLFFALVSEKGAIASMIWLSRTDKGKDVAKNVTDGSIWVAKKGYSIFGKVLVWCLKVIAPKKDNTKK